MACVLIVEDQPAVAKALTLLFDVHGIESRSTSDPAVAIDLVISGDADLVIQDMNFSPGATSGDEGTALFRRIRAADPDIPVLLMTAWTSLEMAVQLIKEGATDYIAKPWDDDKLLVSVRNLLRVRALQLENARLKLERGATRTELAARYDLRDIIYESESMHAIVALALKVARSDVPVLITGPNGSGKEKIAEIIQANSRRKHRPFVRVNAGGIPEDLLESELFGAQAGAFTGATRLRIGRFETANGGTLFLDEIGNLSLAGQAKILRVLQSGEFERLGSSETIRVDARLICATNIDLKAAIRSGAFREDLYFRLAVIEIDVPPLHERRDDILPLAEAFLAQAASSAGIREADDAPHLSHEARSALLSYHWPGNIRELQNRIQRSVLIAQRSQIQASDLGIGAAAEGSQQSSGPLPLSSKADEIERSRIEEEILKAGGSVSRAAGRLGVSRQALYRRMERLGIVLERRPKGS